MNEYQSLNSTHNDYIATHSHNNNEYNDVASKYNVSTGELGTSRSLNYVLVVATIVFLATTVYFVMRKPKAKPEIQTK
jgi:hypothetical protein